MPVMSIAVGRSEAPQASPTPARHPPRPGPKGSCQGSCPGQPASAPREVGTRQHLPDGVIPGWPAEPTETALPGKGVGEHGPTFQDSAPLPETFARAAPAELRPQARA